MEEEEEEEEAGGPGRASRLGKEEASQEALGSAVESGQQKTWVGAQQLCKNECV